jgi:hypothetical protein
METFIVLYSGRSIFLDKKLLDKKGGRDYNYLLIGIVDSQKILFEELIGKHR